MSSEHLYEEINDSWGTPIPKTGGKIIPDGSSPNLKTGGKIIPDGSPNLKTSGTDKVPPVDANLYADGYVDIDFEVRSPSPKSISMSFTPDTTFILQKFLGHSCYFFVCFWNDDFLK